MIRNAKDDKTPEEFQQKLGEATDFFDLIGIRPALVDLREYDSPRQINEVLQTFDVIWGWGGNTFMLLYEMKRSGFDLVIRELLDQGKVYGGESAGAIVAGTSLRGIEFADDPSLSKEVHWDGMALVDKDILPHADSPDPRYVERVPEFIQRYADNPDDLIVLNDNEAFIVDGNESRKVSAPYKPNTHDVDYST